MLNRIYRAKINQTQISTILGGVSRGRGQFEVWLQTFRTYIFFLKRFAIFHTVYSRLEANLKKIIHRHYYYYLFIFLILIWSLYRRYRLKQRSRLRSLFQSLQINNQWSNNYLSVSVFWKNHNLTKFGYR